MGIFRSYDVRGIYSKDLDENIMKRIAAAFSTMSEDTIVIGHDGRTSSIPLKNAFIAGSNKKIVDIGCVPLGVGMLWALNKADYAYITASHLPKEWNGVKFFHKSGVGFMEEEGKNIERIFQSIEVQSGAKVTKVDTQEVLDHYVRYFTQKTTIGKKLSVVLDSGNGMGSVVAKKLFEKEGFEVDSIFDTVDPEFPNRKPDPVSDPLLELKKRTATADIGIAYDGDGDRMGLVDENGRKLSAEQTSYLILLDASKQPGPIIANVECTRVIDDMARKFGKKVVRVPVGHTFLMEGALKHKACFGVEAAGHFAVPHLAPFDDSLMVSLYAATVLSKQDKRLSEIVDEIRIYPSERAKVECSDEKKFAVVNRLKHKFKEEYKNVTTMDGVRVDFHDGWILIRASNTGPKIRLTVEADNEKRLRELKEEFFKRLESEVGNQV